SLQAYSMPVAAHHIVPQPPPLERPPYPADMFAGRTVIVTGGGSAPGLAMAVAFARGGAAAGGMGRSIGRPAGGAAKVAGLGVPVQATSSDVRDPGQVAQAFDTIAAALGPVSLLANNAGANFPVLTENMSMNAWNAVARIAIDGTFLCSSEFARRREAAGEG